MAYLVFFALLCLNGNFGNYVNFLLVGKVWISIISFNLFWTTVMKLIKWFKSCNINRIGDVSLCLLGINVDLFRFLIMVLF